jgi:drug/metabolite transporter (DMT)-like permease
MAELSVLVIMVFWAGNFIAVKSAIAVIPPVAFTFSRFGIAAILLFLLLRLREGSIRLPDETIRRVAVVGILGFGIYQFLWAEALDLITAGDSAVLIATVPVLTALIAGAAGIARLTARSLLGAAVSLAGVAVVVGAGVGFDLGRSFVGDVMTLIAAACFAAYNVYAAPLLASLSPLRVTTWAVLFGTLFLAPVGLLQLVQTDWPRVGGGEALAFVYSTLLAAGLTNVVVIGAIRILGPTRVTAFQFITPLFAVILAALLLQERITAVQVFGGAAILMGVAIARSAPAAPVLGEQAQGPV